uniref:DRBM domain-containing protein n=1 Tax=Angiostrongylus cantonensis TaxID=6313 RepID=A0A0K0CX30_ANGCA
LEAPSEGDSIPKHKQKSVISQVHECALQMKLNVEFEVIKEVGPPHDRSYVVRCSLKNPKNEVSEGRKKKEATQTACANVLSRLSENSPLFIASSLYKLQKRVLNPSREPKRKTIVKDMKMDPTYGHQINPISRLIQVLQARCEDEPQFELVSEQGQSRYKEFTVQVRCGKRICCGSGPNKRLAKRAAAEAMLAEIGYVKPLPPPGKSLLKKKTDSPLNIASPTGQQVSKTNQDSHQASLDPSSFLLTGGESMESSANVPPSPGRRRVTFSNQVKACPPPEDSNYPEPELAPLKADVLIEGRVRRLRRTKEAKSNILHFFLSFAKRRLEIMSETFKFSVQYTNFPKVGSC